MFLCRDVAFCRGRRTNASHLPGEAIRIRKYIHLIHSRWNEIEYVLSLASLSFRLFSLPTLPCLLILRLLLRSLLPFFYSFSSGVLSLSLRSPFRASAPRRRTPVNPTWPAARLGAAVTQAGNQPASQSVQLRFVEQTFLQLLLWRHSSSHHVQLYLVKLICKFLC